jgi:hypothetical protein
MQDRHILGRFDKGHTSSVPPAMELVEGSPGRLRILPPVICYKQIWYGSACHTQL